jgi:hypothetical protein
MADCYRRRLNTGHLGQPAPRRSCRDKALAMHGLTNLYGDLDFWFFVWSRIYIGIGLPLIFIPIMTAAYDGLPPGKTDQASALINVARNVGGSIGISLAQNVLAHRRSSTRAGSWRARSPPVWGFRRRSNGPRSIS